MRPAKLTCILLIAFVILCSMAFANDGGRESHFSIGSGARAVGLGGGFTGLADDASAVYWNPAALARLQYQTIDFLHASLFEGSIYDVATYVYPHHRLGGFGISVMRLGTDDIVRRVDWVEQGEFNFATTQIMLAYGRHVYGGLYLGGGLKIVNQSLDNNSTTGIGFDVSVYHAVSDQLTAGLLFQDIIPPRLRLDDDLETLPFNIIAGLGISHVRFFNEVTHKFNIGMEIPEERDVGLHLGVESTYREWLDVRLGYDRDNVSFGVGIYYKRFRFDYSYRLMEGIDNSHRIGLAFKIGISTAERIRREQELQDAKGSYLIINDRREQFQYYKELGDEYYTRNMLDSAYAYYQRALGFRGDAPQVTARIEEINRVRQARIEEERQEVSREKMFELMMESYYNQALDFFNEKVYGAALSVVNNALDINPASERFLVLKRQINRVIEDRVLTLMDQAEEAESEGRWIEAITLYNDILKLAPERTAVKNLISRVGRAIDIARLINEGVEAFHDGQLGLAEAKFNSVQNLEPGNLVASEYLNRIADRREEPAEQTELEQDERVWRIYLNALEHYQNGEYEKAIDLWQEVLKYYPGNERTLENIKQARLRLESGE